MKLVLSLLAIVCLVSCGKTIQEKSNKQAKRKQKQRLSETEIWSILSERPLPSQLKVVINGMEFANECTGLGNATIERTYKNGTINILTLPAFRQEYFDVEIYDCEREQIYYSENYVDQTEIINPGGTEPTRIILRLRN